MISIHPTTITRLSLPKTLIDSFDNFSGLRFKTAAEKVESLGANVANLRKVVECVLN